MTADAQQLVIWERDYGTAGTSGTARTAGAVKPAGTAGAAGVPAWQSPPPRPGGEPADAWARRHFREGARLARLTEPVDLTGADSPATAVHAIALVRALTGVGIVVDWAVRPAAAAEWRALGHLAPPRAVEGAGTAGAEQIARTWRETHLPGLCIWRRGPGFIEVRDHRAARSVISVLDGPEALDAQRRVLDGAPTAALPVPLARQWAEQKLLLTVGDRSVWLPCRPHHWPFPAMLL
ncbi:DUF5825 family protein [Streptomyces hiroshimensis]|uniref:Uncharacterized protein n=1 Tax=Streptomyces hiroshimensis TaxID=66424 RepID=A0ABQ2YYI1_9ACTN|nr:DUF5825 family protein [Streptomyces hiroshimensis]GGX97946.1 hypothetical protein GCM10010324_50300 [Streptomyces hiroshimensis]